MPRNTDRAVASASGRLAIATRWGKTEEAAKARRDLAQARANQLIRRATELLASATVDHPKDAA